MPTSPISQYILRVGGKKTGYLLVRCDFVTNGPVVNIDYGGLGKTYSEFKPVSVNINLAFSDYPLFLQDSNSHQYVVANGRSIGWYPFAVSPPLQATAIWNGGVTGPNPITLIFSDEIMPNFSWDVEPVGAGQLLSLVNTELF